MQTVCLQFRLRKVCVHPKLAQFLLISRAKTLLCFHSTFSSTLFTCLSTKATLATSLQTFWQTWPARVLHRTPLPSGLTGAWISICLFSTNWLRRNFGLFVEHSRDPMCSRPCVSPARKLVTIVTANVFTMHPAQVPHSDPSLFSARRLQLSLCFESKMAHLVGVQESRSRETSTWLHSSLFCCDTARSGRLRVVGLFGCCEDNGLLFASCGPAQAHGHAPAS